jgi:uncharacterized membrane protein YdfJ with MMPL/SSD domain
VVICAVISAWLYLNVLVVTTNKSAQDKVRSSLYPDSEQLMKIVEQTASKSLGNASSAPHRHLVNATF